MRRWILGCALVTASGCALFVSGSAKVVSQTTNGGTVEATGTFNPDDSRRKANKLIEKHCGSIGHTVQKRDGNQITYTCGRADAAPGGYAPPENCVPNGGRVKNLEHSQCCSGYARDVPYEELDECY